MLSHSLEVRCRWPRRRRRRRRGSSGGHEGKGVEMWKQQLWRRGRWRWGRRSAVRGGGGGGRSSHLASNTESSRLGRRRGIAPRPVEVGRVSPWKGGRSGRENPVAWCSKCPIKSTRGLYSRGLPTRGKRRDPCGDWSFQTKPTSICLVFNQISPTVHVVPRTYPLKLVL